LHGGLEGLTQASKQERKTGEAPDDVIAGKEEVHELVPIC